MVFITLVSALYQGQERLEKKQAENGHQANPTMFFFDPFIHDGNLALLKEPYDPAHSGYTGHKRWFAQDPTKNDGTGSSEQTMPQSHGKPDGSKYHSARTYNGNKTFYAAHAYHPGTRSNTPGCHRLYTVQPPPP